MQDIRTLPQCLINGWTLSLNNENENIVLIFLRDKSAKMYPLFNLRLCG
jgi:hypothetical protein